MPSTLACHSVCLRRPENVPDGGRFLFEYLGFRWAAVMPSANGCANITVHLPIDLWQRTWEAAEQAAAGKLPQARARPLQRSAPPAPVGERIEDVVRSHLHGVIGVVVRREKERLAKERRSNREAREQAKREREVGAVLRSVVACVERAHTAADPELQAQREVQAVLRGVLRRVERTQLDPEGQEVNAVLRDVIRCVERAEQERRRDEREIAWVMRRLIARVEHVYGERCEAWQSPSAGALALVPGRHVASNALQRRVASAEIDDPEYARRTLVQLDRYLVSLGAVAGLVEGWSIRIDVRQTGGTAGLTDVYYFDERGKKFRSRLEVARHFRLEGVPQRAKKGKHAMPPPEPPPHGVWGDPEQSSPDPLFLMPPSNPLVNSPQHPMHPPALPQQPFQFDAQQYPTHHTLLPQATLPRDPLQHHIQQPPLSQHAQQAPLPQHAQQAPLQYGQLQRRIQQALLLQQAQMQYSCLPYNMQQPALQQHTQQAPMLHSQSDHYLQQPLQQVTPCPPLLQPFTQQHAQRSHMHHIAQPPQLSDALQPQPLERDLLRLLSQGAQQQQPSLTASQHHPWLQQQPRPSPASYQEQRFPDSEQLVGVDMATHASHQRVAHDPGGGDGSSQREAMELLAKDTYEALSSAAVPLEMPPSQLAPEAPIEDLIPLAMDDGIPIATEVDETGTEPGEELVMAVEAMTDEEMENAVDVDSEDESAARPGVADPFADAQRVQGGRVHVVQLDCDSDTDDAVAVAQAWLKLPLRCALSHLPLTDPAKGDCCAHAPTFNYTELRAYVGRSIGSGPRCVKACPLAGCNAKLQRPMSVIRDDALRGKLCTLPHGTEAVWIRCDPRTGEWAVQCDAPQGPPSRGGTGSSDVGVIRRDQWTAERYPPHALESNLGSPSASYDLTADDVDVSSGLLNGSGRQDGRLARGRRVSYSNDFLRVGSASAGSHSPSRMPVRPRARKRARETTGGQRRPMRAESRAHRADQQPTDGVLVIEELD